jgi:arylsulfatase
VLALLFLSACAVPGTLEARLLVKRMTRFHAASAAAGRSPAAPGPALAPPQPARADRRPNIVVILADDMGFSDAGCYGGEIRTPNIDRMAREGVRFTQFYNMARCCPTRASLLTGLYPHQAGVGAMNQDLGKPAYQGELNAHCVTLAEVLRGAGYHTGMAGKWHLCRVNIARVPGPKQKAMLAFTGDEPISPSKQNWPCNRGFEDHWGTIPGVASYYDPYGLVHNEETIRPEGKRFYYTDFITDHAVGMIDRFSGSGKPFFLYVAYTAPHWPMQAPEADVARYRSVYRAGWDAIRERRFARQVQMGLVKKEWGLSPRASNPALNDGASRVGPWEGAPEKEWQARRMAVYAAMIERMDRGIGRILDRLQARGIDRNTLVVFLSDNGGCQENVRPEWYDVPDRTRDGRRIHVGNDPEFMPGPEEVFQSYGPAWANASNTPFRRFKHFTEEGGISTPFIGRWPAGRLQPGRIERDAVGSVIDLMPTALDLAGAEYPKTYRRMAVTPAEGRSLLAVLKSGGTLDRGALCWEHEGNRAVRIGDWKLVAVRGGDWQLFNLAADRTELKDLSRQHPEQVEALKAAYEAWAKRCGVEPWPVR